MYTRQELADMFGVSVFTIKKYTKNGIIPPPSPRRGRYARYNASHVAAMREIWGWNGLKDTNMTLAQYAERKRLEAGA